MALWRVNLSSPCVTYRDHGSCYAVPPTTIGGAYLYNKYLVTCPRHYKESFNGWLYTNKFFYEPGNDKLIWYVASKAIDYDVELLLFKFDPVTGAMEEREHIPYTLPNFFSFVNCRFATAGSFNKIYAVRSGAPYIYEVNWYGLNYNGGLYFDLPPLSGWYVDPSSWTPPGNYAYAVVNRIDKIIAGGYQNKIDCWRNADMGLTPEKFGVLTTPDTIAYMAYESRKYLWVITQGGVILKADYTVPRWEMISTVQNPVADTTAYYITFDTKRHRVVVLRLREDTADGAAQHQLELYYPMVEPYQLTQPVPVTSLLTGEPVVFVAHLIGDAGEGLTPYLVNASLAEPATGRLLTPYASTELNGRVSFRYQSAEAGIDTLNLSVTVEESL